MFFRHGALVLSLGLCLGSVVAWSAPVQSETATAQPAYNPPLVNVRVNPIGLAFETFTADIEVGVARAFTLGTSLGYLFGSSGTTNSYYYQFGVVATWFLSETRFSDTPFLRVGAYYLPLSLTRSSGGTTFTGTSRSYAGGIVGGYEWMVGRHFNLNLGAGMSYYAFAANVPATSPGGTQLNVHSAGQRGLNPMLEASVGWAF